MRSTRSGPPSTPTSLLAATAWRPPRTPTRQCRLPPRSNPNGRRSGGSDDALLLGEEFSAHDFDTKPAVEEVLIDVERLRLDGIGRIVARSATGVGWSISCPGPGGCLRCRRSVSTSRFVRATGVVSTAARRQHGGKRNDEHHPGADART